MIIRMDYHPSAAQRRFHETDADEALFGGEVGSGKTKADVMDALFDSVKYPGIVTYIFRATYQQGTDTIVEEIEKSYPPQIGRYNKEDTTYYFVNGSKIKIRQCKTLEDAKKNDGKEFCKLKIDEPQHLNHDAYDYLCTRVRANVALGVKPQIKLSAMQGGKGHAWIKRVFVDPLRETPNTPVEIEVVDDRTGDVYTITREFIPAATRDNKHVDSGYIARLSARSERNKRKFMTSDWNAIEGQAFPEWVDKPYDDDKKPTDKWTHVITAFPIPAHWPIYRGFDYGRASPFSALWFTRGDEVYSNRLFLIAELYGGTEDEEGLNKSASEIAEMIAAVEKPLMEKHGWVDGVADPSIFSRSAFSDESIADVFSKTLVANDTGLIFRDPRFDPEVHNNVINNRLQGKSLIHELLRFDGEGHPGVQVFDNCVKFRKHFPELVSAPKNPDDVDSEGTADHDYDACLAGDTLVWTDKGKLKIEELAGTSGKAFSSDGNLHEYSDCRKTKRNADVYEVELEDGTKFTATENHPVMLKTGEFAFVGNLKIGDELRTIGEQAL